MMLEKVVAGNWKMNKTPKEGVLFVNDVKKALSDISSTSVVFSPPFTGLVEINVEPPFYLSAQNCHWEESGAYTGEISLPILKKCGVEVVILGHSERRTNFGETDDMVNKKINSTIHNNIIPILCIGESLEQRENGQTEAILESQLKNSLKGISGLSKIIVAYEPIWAIGSGLVASNQQIQNAHQFINQVLNKLFNEKLRISVLYGGSVKPKNAESLINIKGVDGFLIGGASLNAESFISIIKIVEKS